MGNICITATCRARSVQITAAQQGPPGPSGSVSARESLDPTAAPWTLATTPTRPDLSDLYLNGQKVRYLVDYNLNGPIVTWLGVPLVASDYLEINYT